MKTRGPPSLSPSLFPTPLSLSCPFSQTHRHTPSLWLFSSFLPALAAGAFAAPPSAQCPTKADSLAVRPAFPLPGCRPPSSRRGLSASRPTALCGRRLPACAPLPSGPLLKTASAFASLSLSLPLPRPFLPPSLVSCCALQLHRFVSRPHAWLLSPVAPPDAMTLALALSTLDSLPAASASSSPRPPFPFFLQVESQ